MSEKWFAKSKTLWGAAIGFVPHLLVLTGRVAEPGSIEQLQQAGTDAIDAAWILFNAVNELIGLVLVFIGRFKASEKVTLTRPKEVSKQGGYATIQLVLGFCALALLALVLAACAKDQYSDDPEIATVQKWAEGCTQMGQAIRTATVLWRSGNLTEAEAGVVDKVDAVYRPVCTGEPGDLNRLVLDEGVNAAVKALCPELASSAAEWQVTVAQATACAARKALLLQLEAP